MTEFKDIIPGCPESPNHTFITAFICKKLHAYLLAALFGELRIIVSSVEIP